MEHMRYLSIKNSNFSFKDLLILFIGIIAITLQLFFLPFHVWDAGVARPWYMLHDYIPYRDFVWIRMPFDLFVLTGWYKIFGATGYAYQLFIYTELILLSILVFFSGRVFLKKFYYLPFFFFNVFLFPLFQNTEEGEILVGILSLLLFLTISAHFKNKRVSYVFIAGLISGLSFITKQNSALILIATFAALFFDFYINKEKIKILLRNFLIYSSGVLVPVIGIILYFIFKQGLEDFLHYTIFFIGSYSQAYVIKGNGLLIVFAYMSLLVPFILLFKKTALSAQSFIFLLLLIVSLFPSMFPSFLSYRAFTAYPLISIVAGILLAISIGTSIKKMGMAVIFIGLILFIFFNKTFIDSYIISIKYGEFKYGQYLTSYGETESEIAGLIGNNSKDGDKIINYGSEMIYVLSNRLPANKHVDPFPYLLYPYEETTKVFTDNPPKLVVYDESLPNDHPGLSEWPFIDFLHNNYDIVKKFDKSLILYKYRSN